MQLPGVFGPSWQVKQTSHRGAHAHEPQSTACWQVLVTLPHVPAHVWATDSGVQPAGAGEPGSDAGVPRSVSLRLPLRLPVRLSLSSPLRR